MYEYSINEGEFARIRDYLYGFAGIKLTSAKKQLVVSRLSGRLRHFGFQSLGEYFDFVFSGNQANENQLMIDLLTTNETYFFREATHFDFLAQLAMNCESNDSEFRVWSAACSSGQEVYSIATVLAEAFGTGGNWNIDASDISSRVLKTSRRSLYPIEQARNIPKDYLNKYCLKGVGSMDGFFMFDKQIRNKISFSQLNLNKEWGISVKYDVIFLRNVMIYFDSSVKSKIVNKMAEFLNPGGHLIIGLAESLSGISSPFKQVQPSVFKVSG